MDTIEKQRIEQYIRGWNDAMNGRGMVAPLDALYALGYSEARA